VIEIGVSETPLLASCPLPCFPNEPLDVGACQAECTACKPTQHGVSSLVDRLISIQFGGISIQSGGVQ
jgi:hypothetical protein